MRVLLYSLLTTNNDPEKELRDEIKTSLGKINILQLQSHQTNSIYYLKSKCYHHQRFRNNIQTEAEEVSRQYQSFVNSHRQRVHFHQHHDDDLHNDIKPFSRPPLP